MKKKASFKKKAEAPDLSRFQLFIKCLFTISALPGWIVAADAAPAEGDLARFQIFLQRIRENRQPV